MPSRRSSASKLLVPIIVGLLLCGVIAAELPELLSLTDNTSNDFTLRKSPAPQGAQNLRAASNNAGRVNTEVFADNQQFGRTAAFDEVKRVSPNLFVVLCTLRT